MQKRLRFFLGLFVVVLSWGSSPLLAAEGAGAAVYYLPTETFSQAENRELRALFEPLRATDVCDGMDRDKPVQ